MRPQWLQMEGFGAFRASTEVDFTDVDLVALVGATGSGKSTIIDAITFALYGAVARYDDNRAVAPVINQTSTRARVRLDFELGGTAYTAVRIVQRTRLGATTREARLERGADVLADDAREMSTVIEELLGLDVDQFNRTVVLPQGRFADFLHDRPANRQATLRQLLGLEMYHRIGQAARQRRDAARNQVDALRPELQENEGLLTDEHRATLERDISAIADVRARFGVDCESIAAGQRRSEHLDERRQGLTGQLSLLSGIEVPPDITDLGGQLASATSCREAATIALNDARESRRRAAEAAAAGPDLARCTFQLASRRAAAALLEEHRSVIAELTAATDALAIARLAAEVVATRQRALDAAVGSSRAAEERTRTAATDGPNPVQLDVWIQLHAGRAACCATLTSAEDEEALASAALEPLAEAALAAAAAEDAAQLSLVALRERIGAAAYASLLAVGEPCPLCLQEVHDLPTHDLDDEQWRAEAAFEAAVAHRTSANGQRDLAQEKHRSAVATVTAQRQALAGIDGQLVDVAGLDELREQHVEADRLQTAFRQAVEAEHNAIAAAAHHRDDPNNIDAIDRAVAARDRATGLISVEADLARRVEQAHADLADVPDESVLVAAIADAKRLAGERGAADRACESAQTECDAANSSVHELQQEVRAAEHHLRSVRDRVAALGAPVVAGADLGTDWATLAKWSFELHASLRTELEAVDDDLASASVEVQRLDDEARARCAAVLTGDISATSLPALGERLVVRKAEAQGSLVRFDERRRELIKLRRRIEVLGESASIADTLGHLLRADGFEGWLMHSALEGLVDAASVRLRELSGGQFSLELAHRAFAVRDHANADELRGARTLSGGETFLASLSLALALADATAELAPEGAPAIESIFLDEGFGTLDSGTLDTVASAIEELGATGRMVGVVTHIRELADRMPVRLEVTKTAATSTVARIEV